METVLVPIDFSELGASVVEHAAQVAEAASTKLVLLHVGPPAPDFVGQQLYRKVVSDGDELPEPLREAYEKLRGFETDLRARGIEVESLFVQGKSVESILEEAERLEADMIVIGSHRGGTLYRLLGSTSEGVLRGAPCPVLVVPGGKR